MNKSVSWTCVICRKMDHNNTADESCWMSSGKKEEGTTILPQLLRKTSVWQSKATLLNTSWSGKVRESIWAVVKYGLKWRPECTLWILKLFLHLPGSYQHTTRKIAIKSIRSSRAEKIIFIRRWKHGPLPEFYLLICSLSLFWAAPHICNICALFKM